MKKFLAILMAAMMLLAMTAAFAEETTKYTITINNADADYVYTAYQIFAGDLADGVLSNITWGTGVSADGKAALGDAAAKAKTIVTSDDAAAFATALSAYLSAGTNSEYDSTNSCYKIKDLPAGYYLVENTTVPQGGAYTKYIVKVVANVSADPKTAKTTQEKKVNENVKQATNPKEGSVYKNYNDVADYNIGDTVPFALYSSVPDLTNFTTYQMTFHDKMSAGLTFDASSVKVFVANTEIAADKYTVSTNVNHAKEGEPADICTFDVKIHELKGYDKGAQVRVEFNATLNENAVIGLDGNPNQSKLEFSNNPNVTTDTTETPWDYVVVFTYELDVTKIDGAQAEDDNGNKLYVDKDGNETTVAENNTPLYRKLAGAEFVLRVKNGSYVKVDESGKVTGWTANKDEATVLTSGSDGLFKVIGLDDGTYELVETKAPAGYNLIADPIEVVIAATTTNDHTYANTASTALTALKINVAGEGLVNGDMATGKVSATVENNVGATLPSTGGIGTTLFYLFGGIMTAGSALILVVRRRAENEEE